MLHVYSGYPPQEQASLSQVPCQLLVVQDEWHEPVAVPADWTLFWQGARPGNLKERFRAFSLAQPGP